MHIPSSVPRSDDDGDRHRSVDPTARRCSTRSRRASGTCCPTCSSTGARCVYTACPPALPRGGFAHTTVCPAVADAEGGAASVRSAPARLRIGDSGACAQSLPRNAHRHGRDVKYILSCSVSMDLPAPGAPAPRQRSALAAQLLREQHLFERCDVTRVGPRSCPSERGSPSYYHDIVS